MPRPPKVTLNESEAARLRRTIARVLPPVLQRLYDLAMRGDVQAAKLLLDRALPPLAPVRDTVVLNGETPEEWRADLLAKVAGGDIAPREALVLLELFDRMPSAKREKPPMLDGETLKAVKSALYGTDDNGMA
jgi:hypothetical protein